MDSIAELVLQPLNADVVDRAVGREARQEKTRQSARRLREDQEGVRHRCGKEPLVPDDPVVAVAERLRRRRVRSQVGAALLLGHPHPQRHAALAVGGNEPGVVVGCEDPRQPRRRDRAVAHDRGHDRVGHRRRAKRAVLDFGVHHEQRGALDVRARRRVGPGAGRNAMPFEVAHQLVIRRMEFHLVAPPAGGIEELQRRRIAVRRRAERDHVGGAEFGTALGEPRRRRAGAFALHRLLQRAVVTKQIAVFERRCLVRDFVGGE